MSMLRGVSAVVGVRIGGSGPQSVTDYPGEVSRASQVFDDAVPALPQRVGADVGREAQAPRVYPVQPVVAAVEDVGFALGSHSAEQRVGIQVAPSVSAEERLDRGPAPSVHRSSGSVADYRANEDVSIE